MNLLLISEIRENLTPPAFGGEFAAHIERKTNPAVRAASLTAWNLLAEGLERMGFAGHEPESARLHDAAPEGVDAPGKMPPLMSAHGGKDSLTPKSAAGHGKMPPPLMSARHGKDSLAPKSAAAPEKMSLSLMCARDGKDSLAPKSAAGHGKMPPSLDCVCGGKTSPSPESAVGVGKMPLIGGAAPSAQVLPAVRFGAAGKPEFADCPLHFSLAHSGKLAVALLSSSPCGVDVERIRPEVDERLRARCLSGEEQRLGLDFFECWTKKECIGKLTGRGIDAHPGKIDTLDARWAGRFLFETLTDSAGQSYALAALCEGAGEIACSIVRI